MSLTCFGGPQAHLALFIQHLVYKHRYITESEIMEMQALCQLLPGPTSTQTITAIGFKLGGAKVSYFTLLVWILPATVFMGVAALGISFFEKGTLVRITQFIKPMGVAFIFFAAFIIGKKVIKTKTSIVLMTLSAFAGFYFRSPYITPILILLGGVVASENTINKRKC